MESRKEDTTAGGSHKPCLEPLVINQSPTSGPQSFPDDVEPAFSEDYNDSPRSVDTKSPLASSNSGSGDCLSDDRSSVGTIDADDCPDNSLKSTDVHITDAASKKKRADLQLSLVRPASEVYARNFADHRIDSKDDDEEFDHVAEKRRSTSLKTCKTPPVQSPGRKKEVRFADALGLDLESVKHIINADEPPIVPVSAVKHLTLRGRADSAGDFVAPRRRLLHACFSQPGMTRHFAERVADRRVSLQSCFVSSDAIDGVVRVANVAFRKRVWVRYTLNGWLTFDDLTAGYIHGSNDGVSDQFRFSMNLPESFGLTGNAVEFSIGYEAGDNGDAVFWDSNFGANYRVECYTSSR